MSSDSVLALKLLPGKFVVVERSDGAGQPMQWRLFKIHNVALSAAELVEYDPDAATATAASRVEHVSWSDISLAIAPYQLGVGQRVQALWPNLPDFSDLTTVYYSATVSGLKAPAKQKVKTKAVIFDTGETLAVPYVALFEQQEVPAIMVPQPVTPQMVKLAVQRVQQAAAHLQQSSAQVAQRTASPAAGGSTTASPRTTADAIAVIQSLKRKAEAASPHTDSPANKRQATATPLHSGSMPAAARPPPSAAPTGRTGLITPLPPAAHAAQHLKHQQAVAQQQQQQQQKGPKKELAPREKRSWHVEWADARHCASQPAAVVVKT